MDTLERLSLGAQVDPHALIQIKHLRFPTDKQPPNKIGNLQSKKWGSGLEFDQLRAYVFGDDPRFIDWKASSRLNTLYTKQFIEDKDANCLIVIDLREGMYFGSKKRLLSVLACYCAAVLGWKWMNIGYAVSLELVTAKRTIQHKPTHSEHQFKKQLFELSYQHNAQTIQPSHNKMLPHLKPGQWQKFDHIAIITDILSVDNDLIQTMAHKVRTRKKIVVGVMDPLLTSIPGNQWFSDGGNSTMGSQLYSRDTVEKQIQDSIEQAERNRIIVATPSTDDALRTVARSLQAA